MQLFPQQNFTVVRQIPDPADVTTYYPQAVIRDAFTDELLATLNLTAKGSQRYKKEWLVCADPSNQGRYISVITSVYTDSGHTTKSTLYGDDENTYLVLARQLAWGGGSGSDSPSLKEIREVIREEIEASETKEKEESESNDADESEEEYQDPRIEEVLNALGAIKELVAKIPTEKDNDSAILNKLQEIRVAIDGIEMPKLDLTPVLARIEEECEDADHRHEESMKNNRDSVKEAFKNLSGFIYKSVAKAIRETNFITSFVTSVHQSKGSKQDPEDEVEKINNSEVTPKKSNEVDLKKLAS